MYIDEHYLSPLRHITFILYRPMFISTCIYPLSSQYSYLSIILGASTVLIVGGVGCNMRLQDMMNDMARDRGATVCAMDHRSFIIIIIMKINTITIILIIIISN